MNERFNHQNKKIKRVKSSLDTDREKVTELEDEGAAFTQNTGMRTKNIGKNIKGC